MPERVSSPAPAIKKGAKMVSFLFGIKLNQQLNLRPAGYKPDREKIACNPEIVGSCPAFVTSYLLIFTLCLDQFSGTRFVKASKESKMHEHNSVNEKIDLWHFSDITHHSLITPGI